MSVHADSSGKWDPLLLKLSGTHCTSISGHTALTNLITLHFRVGTLGKFATGQTSNFTFTSGHTVPFHRNTLHLRIGTLGIPPPPPARRDTEHPLSFDWWREYNTNTTPSCSDSSEQLESLGSLTPDSLENQSTRVTAPDHPV